MEWIETLADFYCRHPVNNRSDFPENNTGQGHFNVFAREPKSLCAPFGRRDFYKVTLVQGKGRMIYADQVIEVDRPSLIFTGPAVPSAWESDPGPQTGFFCLFTQAFIEAGEYKGRLPDFPLFKPGNPHVLPLDEQQQGWITALMQRMQQVMLSDYRVKYDMLRSYLRVLMHEALLMFPELLEDTSASAAARITAQFLDLLEAQFPIDSPEQPPYLHTPAGFAQRLAVHTNHLNRSVKAVTGQTTGSLIAARLLREAQALLRHTDWSIAQIAGGLGFEEPSYFANFFRKYTGNSPQQSRAGQ